MLLNQIMALITAPTANKEVADSIPAVKTEGYRQLHSSRWFILQSKLSSGNFINQHDLLLGLSRLS